MRWRAKADTPPGGSEPSYHSPAGEPPWGHRDSRPRVFADGEVVSSTYQVQALLSADDVGQVYEAWDMLLERTVALKAATRDDDAPSLLSEARVPGAIADACAAEVYGVGHHRGVEYMAGERIRGVNLHDHVARIHAAGAAVAVDDASALLARLARGLAAIHAAGLRLPHLCTRGVALTAADRVVVCRFAMDQCALPHQPVCWAPEVLSAPSPEAALTAGPAADLYALGLVAWELLTGGGPFDDDSRAARSHLHRPPPPLADARPDVPAELADLVGELLAKEPYKRPPGAGDVVAQLRTIAQRASRSRRLVHVLLVDDDEPRRRLLASLLRRAHARAVVEVAASADDAAPAIARRRPDVLVVSLDVAGEMNGLELCMYARGVGVGDGDGDGVIVALTPRVEPSDVKVLEKLGVAHVLVRNDAAPARLAEIVRERAGPSLSWPGSFAPLADP